MRFVDSNAETSRTLPKTLLRLALIFHLVIGLAVSAAASPSPLKPYLVADIHGSQIRFQLFGKLVYVPVRINNSGPFWFILDSGAQNSVIDERVAKALGLKVQGQANVIGIGESSVKVGFAKHVSLTFGEVEFADQDLVVYPCETLEHFTGHVINGILGANVFKRFAVEIDYSSRTVNLYDSKTTSVSQPQGDSLPLIIEGGLPFIRGRIVLCEGTILDVKILIDTGGNGALALNRPFVDAHKLPNSIKQTIESPDAGAGGEAIGRLGRVSSLQLGRFVIENPITGFSRSIKGALAVTSNDGYIGGEVLRRFKVLFDYYHGRLMLEPNEHFSEAYEAEMSGILLTTEGSDLKTLRIKRTIEDSPAAQAGLLSGDVIISIDGRPTLDFNLEQVNELFKQPGRTLLLSVKRRDRVFQVQLELRRLI